ncbi:MAG: acyl-CoA dehydrogenase family protein [Candidatus Dormiibacterota bacterium]
MKAQTGEGRLQVTLTALRERVAADPDDVGRNELAWLAARVAAAEATRAWADRSGDALATQVAEASEALALGEDAIELGRRHAAIARAARPLEDVGASAEECALRSRYRAFADREVRPNAEAIHRENLPVPDSIIEGAAALGLFDLSSGDRRHMLIATEELSAASLNAAGSLITRPEILIRALRNAGTPAQRARWLPDITGGRRMVAVAVTEPDTGSDVAALHECTAEPAGARWVLNGRKRFAGFSGRAELMAVLARTNPDGRRGLSLFVVEKPRIDDLDFVHEQPEGGRLVATAIPILGYRGMRTYDLLFESYLTPEDALIGAEGQGFYLQLDGFSSGRLQTAGRAVGVMQAALGEAFAYTRRRVVFGSPIADLQLAQATLGSMVMRLESSRQLSYRAAALLDAGRPQEGGDPGAGQMEASLAKLYAAHQAETVTRDAMQLHGGIGYSEATPVSRYFVDGRVLPIFEGAEEVLALRVVARQLLR